MKATILALALSIFSSSVLAYCIGTYDGVTMVLPGPCITWNQSFANAPGNFDCQDLPGSPFMPNNPPNNVVGATNGEQYITFMDGSSSVLASDKTHKNLRAIKDPSQIKFEDLQKMLKKGKTSKKMAQQLAKEVGANYTNVSTKLRDKGRTLEAAETCIDDIYNQRKETWKKLGLTPLSVLSGGLIGAGAGAGGAFMAVNGSLISAELIKRIGIASFISQGAVYGSAIGAIGMGAWMIGKGIYHGVELMQNARMMDLIAQARMPDRYGMPKKFTKFAGKMFKRKNKSWDDIKDSDIISRIISQLDQSGRLCAKGDVASYFKLKKHLKKRAKDYIDNSGAQSNISCQLSLESTGQEFLSCKVKEKANRTKCRMNMDQISNGGVIYIAGNEKENCSIGTSKPSKVSIALSMNNGQLRPESLELPKGTTALEFQLTDKNKVMFFKSRIYVNEGGQSSTQNCSYNLQEGGEGQARQLSTTLNSKFDTVAKKTATNCMLTQNADGSLELTGKTKEKGNISKCKMAIAIEDGGPLRASITMISGQMKENSEEFCSISSTKMSGAPADRVLEELKYEVNATGRTGRNPQTGKEIKISAKTSVIDHTIPGGNVTHRNNCSSTSSNGQNENRCNSVGESTSSVCSISYKKDGGGKVKTEIIVEKDI